MLVTAPKSVLRRVAEDVQNGPGLPFAAGGLQGSTGARTGHAAAQQGVSLA